MKVLIALFVILPSVVNAQSIFSDDEDYAKKEDSSVLGSLFGSTQVTPKSKWEKFKSLQDYGQSPDMGPPPQAAPDPNEVKAAQDYYKSKDPFSNSNRLDQVYENLGTGK